MKAFGPKAGAPEWQEVHQQEGAATAREILPDIAYEADKIKEILIPEIPDLRLDAANH